MEFTAQIGRLRAVDPPPDAIYVPATTPDEMVPLLAALRAAFPTTPILGGDNYDGAPILTINGQAMSNIYYTTHGQWPPPGPGPAQDFATAYEKEYGKPPSSIFPALAYEGTQLLLDALGRAKATDPAAIRQALEATQNFVGVTGTLSYSGSPGGHIPNKSVAVMEIQGGQVKLAQMLAPRAVPPP
jgi:branched-chain amino acid transport system substrate-binding protein